MSKYFFIALGLSFTVVSCKKINDIPNPLPANELELKVQPTFGTVALSLDSVYTTDEGYRIQFEEVKFYATNLQNNGKNFMDVALFDFKGKGTSFVKTIGSSSDFGSLSGVLGVDSVRNHADPAAFSVTNPLNIGIAGNLHWGWNPGYIFIYVDAKIDTIPNGIDNLDHVVSYHVGQDQLKKSLNFQNITWITISKDVTRASLILDMKNFLKQPNSLNLKSENITHSAPGTEVLSGKVITNFANAIIAL